MKIIVEKYGGSSLSTPEKIKAVARQIAGRRQSGVGYAIVVSAMGETTDRLNRLALKVGGGASKRELAQLLATGEVVSASLLALALQALGVKAISLTAAQAGISARGPHDCARICAVAPEKILAELRQGAIVVVAGFQGQMGREMVVCGRGGSDASAVALAAALQADYCSIYSDVAGVYFTDPRTAPNATRLPCISYEEMIELAASGARIMMGRAVEIARRCHVKIFVTSSSEPSEGTWITHRRKSMENQLITGIALNTRATRLDLRSETDGPRLLESLLYKTGLTDGDVKILCVKNEPRGGYTLSLLLREPHTVTRQRLRRLQKATGHRPLEYSVQGEIAEISITGYGLVDNPLARAKIFELLRGSRIEVLYVQSSELSILVLIPVQQADCALAALQAEFDGGEKRDGEWPALCSRAARTEVGHAEN